MKRVAADKNIIYGLWCICHPDHGVRYVGQTRKGIVARFGVHLAHSEWMDSPVYNWIRKHGADNIAYTILEICLPDELDTREEAWIALYREEQGAKLMNVKLGGGASRGHKNPKQSERMTGENNPMWGKDRKELMTRARSFQNFDSEYFANMARGRAGYQHTDESKRKMSERITAAWTEERKENLSQAVSGTSNPQARVTEDQVREMRSIRERTGRNYADIGKQFGVSSGTVSMICRRITWKHVE